MKTGLRIKLLLYVLVCISILCCCNLVNNVNKVDASVNYRAMCVIDEIGQVLFEYNKDIKLAMASTTKIVTAIPAVKPVTIV